MAAAIRARAVRSHALQPLLTLLRPFGRGRIVSACRTELAGRPTPSPTPGPHTRDVHPTIAIITAIAAVAALVRAGWVWRFLRSGATAQGVVVGISADRTGRRADRIVVYRPTVEYTTLDGRAVRYTEKSASSRVPAAVGQPVVVRYNPTDPQQAMIASKGRSEAIGLCVFALVAAGFAIVISQIK